MNAWDMTPTFGVPCLQVSQKSMEVSPSSKSFANPFEADALWDLIART